MEEWTRAEEPAKTTNLWERGQHSLQDDPRVEKYITMDPLDGLTNVDASWSSERQSPQESNILGYSSKSALFWMVVIAILCGCFAVIACVGVVAYKCSRKSAYTFEPK
ncbi:hypothetical protein Ciccas_005448 [Cichlidogyrus casuarinus]|uniref:Uncharacterized protein n=1 Tax=Cichlidogyrus casuarinus TaxID=1844966 RepID=A0ABD2Q9L2_9PLAT